MAKQPSKTISGADVLNFLKENPDFLIKHGHTDWLFQHAHGSGVASSSVVNLNHVITKRAQDALRRSSSVQASMIDITTANHEAQQRIHHLALMIVAASSGDELISMVRHTLPSVLGIAGATLVIASHLGVHAHPDCISLDEGYLPKLTDGAEFSLGEPVGLQGEVFRNILAESPQSVAFAFLPTILPHQNHDMVLALAGHKKDSFAEGQGTDFLQFIAGMLAVGLLARPMASPPESDLSDHG